MALGAALTAYLSFLSYHQGMHVLGRWLWRMGPGNPMVIRIVEGGSRRTRHLWVRMGYLGALMGLVLVGLLAASGASGGGPGGELSLTELAKAGARVFAVIAYGQVILICLLAPLFMSAAIGQERAGETLDILLTTPLSNLQIVLGSLIGRLFFVLALLMSGLPLFAVLLIFGGVPISSVFIAFVVAGLTALLVGSVAVLLSVLRAGGRKAVFVFVISIAAYLAATWVLDVGLVRRVGAVSGQTTWLTPLHPLLVLEALLASANYKPPGPEMLAGYPWIVRFYLGQPFAAFCALTLIASAVLLLISAVYLRRVGQGESRVRAWFRRKLRLEMAVATSVAVTQAGEVNPSDEDMAAKAATPGAMTQGGSPGKDMATKAATPGAMPVVTSGGRRRPPREVGRNPIAWREAHTRGKVAAGILARWGFAALAVLAGLGLLLAYHFGALPTIMDPATNHPLPAQDVFRTALLALLLLEVAVVVLVALYMSAGCVSREREDGTLDLVLTTPITPRQYIWGKLEGLVRFTALLIAVPVITLAMVAIYAWIGRLLQWPQATATAVIQTPTGAASAQFPLMLPEAPLLMALMLVPFVALCVAAGMNCSLKARGVVGAVVPAVAVIGVLTLVLGLCGWNAAENIPILGPIINAFSPATNLVMLINPWENIRGFAGNPTFYRVWLGAAALIAAGGYSAIVWTLITSMVGNFDQTVRRLSGAG